MFKEKHNYANFACMDFSEMRLKYRVECAHSSQILGRIVDTFQPCHMFQRLAGLKF